MKKSFGYIRVSTPKQGEGVSLQEQRAAISRFAEKTGLEIVEWFEEQETAAKRGRPIFMRMLKLLRSSNVKSVVIHKIDRSARNLKDWADLGELIDGGIDVYFANETLDLRTRGGRLAADIQAVVAADYIRNLREETKKGLTGRLKQGVYPFAAPIGYLDQGKGKPKIPDPAMAPLVRRAFEIYATGKFNILELAEKMYVLGLRNKRGTRVSRNGLWVMLKNPFYMGVIYIKRTRETFKSIHEPIVAVTLFQQVQSILRGKAVVTSERHWFQYRRLLTCQHCHYSLIGERQKGYVYYRCHTLGCPTRSVREELITEQIKKDLNTVQLNAADHDFIREKISALRERLRSDHAAQEKALDFSIKVIDERINRLTDLFLDEAINQETFNRKNAALILERRNLEAQLQELRRNPAAIVDKVEKFLELASAASLGHEISTPDERRELLKIVTSNRSVDRKNVSTTLKSPFQALAKSILLLSGALAKDRPRTLDALLSKLLELFAQDPEILDRRDVDAAA